MGKKIYHRQPQTPHESHETPKALPDEDVDLVGKYVPITPGGTPLIHLAADTNEEAWSALMEDAVGMPYESKEEFETRGYTVFRVGY